MADLRHIRVHRTTTWKTGSFGIQEPSPLREEDVLASADLDTLDAVIVPILAFDPQGHRLGYGKGYYDRFLAST